MGNDSPLSDGPGGKEKRLPGKMPAAAAAAWAKERERKIYKKKRDVHIKKRRS
jgi:hypothetical protein